MKRLLAVMMMVLMLVGCSATPMEATSSITTAIVTVAKVGKGTSIEKQKYVNDNFEGKLNLTKEGQFGEKFRQEYKYEDTSLYVDWSNETISKISILIPSEEELVFLMSRVTDLDEFSNIPNISSFVDDLMIKNKASYDKTDAFFTGKSVYFNFD